MIVVLELELVRVRVRVLALLLLIIIIITVIILTIVTLMMHGGRASGAGRCRVGRCSPSSLQSPSLYILQRGVQWKQDVVICMVLYYVTI